jgi:hypothetical protein
MLVPAVRLTLANSYHLVTHTGQFGCCTLGGSEHWMRNQGQSVRFLSAATSIDSSRYPR